MRAAFPEEHLPSLRKQLQSSEVIPALIELAKLGRLPTVKALNLADITIVEHLETGKRARAHARTCRRKAHETDCILHDIGGYRAKLGELPVFVHIWPASTNSADLARIREQVAYLSFLTHPNLLQFHGASLETSDLSVAREFVGTCLPCARTVRYTF